MKLTKALTASLAIVTVLVSTCGCVATTPPQPDPLSIADMRVPENAWDMWTVPKYVDQEWVAHMRIELPEDELDPWLQASGFPAVKNLEPGDYLSLSTEMSEHINWDLVRRAHQGNTPNMSYSKQRADGPTRHLIVVWPGWGAIAYVVADGR